MNTDRKAHLTSDEIIAAVVDRGDLTAHAESHLAVCDHCRKEAEKTRAMFAALGETARQSAPLIPVPVRIPKEHQKIRLSRDWGLRPVLGVAAAFCLVVAVIGGGLFKYAGQRANLAQTGNGTAAFFEEADRLVENAMPVYYQKIIERDAFRPGDDMMDFIVPPVNETGDFIGNPETENGKEMSHA